ncbi:hypothetical protein PCE1_001590 [Barthelona sp. PCE]
MDIGFFLLFIALFLCLNCAYCDDEQEFVTWKEFAYSIVNDFSLPLISRKRVSQVASLVGTAQADLKGKPTTLFPKKHDMTGIAAFLPNSKPIFNFFGANLDVFVNFLGNNPQIEVPIDSVRQGYSTHSAVLRSFIGEMGLDTSKVVISTQYSNHTTKYIVWDFHDMFEHTFLRLKDVTRRSVSLDTLIASLETYRAICSTSSSTFVSHPCSLQFTIIMCPILFNFDDLSMIEYIKHLNKQSMTDEVLHELMLSYTSLVGKVTLDSTLSSIFTGDFITCPNTNDGLDLVIGNSFNMTVSLGSFVNVFHRIDLVRTVKFAGASDMTDVSRLYSFVGNQRTQEVAIGSAAYSTHDEYKTMKPPIQKRDRRRDDSLDIHAFDAVIQLPVNLEDDTESDFSYLEVSNSRVRLTTRYHFSNERTLPVDIPIFTVKWGDLDTLRFQNFFFIIGSANCALFATFAVVACVHFFRKLVKRARVHLDTDGIEHETLLDDPV